MKKKKEFRKYLCKQSLFGLGMANGVLTVVLFYFKLGSNFAGMNYQELLHEMLMTGAIIGVSVSVIGAFFTRKEIKKGNISVFSKEHIINYIVPDMKPLQAIFITMYTIGFMALFAMIVFAIWKDCILNFNSFMLSVFVICSLVSAFAAILSIEKTVHSGTVCDC